MNTVRVLLLAGVAAGSFATSAQAQEATSGDSEKADQSTAEIVVTAQRRAERIQDVPIAISVVGSDQLDRQQVTSISDLARSTAAVQFGSSSGTGGGAFIRGIGTASLTRGAESAVGLVIDGVVQGNTNVSNLFDISRVEVLRGPQGTLFGQSVSAGVINISTLAPDPSRMSGKITAEAAFDAFAGSEVGRQVIRGGVNLPVSSTSALRISGFLGQTTGVLRNVFKNENDSFHEGGIRARYMAELGETVTINLIGEYNSTKGQDGQFFTYIGTPPAATATSLAACGVTPRPGNLEHCAGAPERTTRETLGFSGQIDAELGSLTLTSITAYREQDQAVTGDIDRQPNAPGPDITSGVATAYSLLTQEVRLATDPDRPLSAVVGAFYFKADTDAQTGPAQGGTVTLPTGVVTGTVTTESTQTETISAFGEARFKTGDLTVFAGGRFTDSNLKHSGTRQSVTVVGTIPNGALLSTNYRFEDSDFAWRVGAQYKLSGSVMTYGSIARGYKNAQLSPILVLNNVPILERVVQPEKPTAFELGVKTTTADGRFGFNVNGFYQRIRNLQAQTFVTLSDTPVPALLPANVSRIVSKGFEADAFGRIGDHLTLNASAVYNIAKYPIDYRDRNNVSLLGQQIAFAPRFAANFSGEYTVDLNDTMEGFISIDGRYRGKTRMSDERVEGPLSIDKARWIFGGRIGARVTDRWSASIYVNNIGGSRIPALYTQLLNTQAAFYTNQSVRQVGLQAQFDF